MSNNEQKPEVPAGGKIKWFKSFWFRIFSGAALLIAVVFIFIGYFYIYRGAGLRPHYAEAYTLVQDSISQSANILINLPEGVAKEGIEKNISFTQEIKGRWVENAASDKVEFDPDDNLDIGKYYTVSLSAAQGKIGKDFLAAEDPEVVSIFPKSESEANENSDITIIFNRPMVPLTTLDILEEKEIPVEIEPQTQGKFKWIGTRSLQFIPEDHLIASAHYKVKVKSGFTSIDGLEIKEFEHNFITRKLRYEEMRDGAMTYREPISLNFNQPVEIDRTIGEISLYEGDENKKIDFIAKYGTKKVFNKKEEKYDEIEDQSKILIFNKMDRHNREKFWDFKTNYKLEINAAHPQGGDIILNEKREIHIQVSDIIADISASSERSEFSSPALFDPEGKLWISFYEDVDLEKSGILSDYITGSGYGEKCKGEGEEEFYYGGDVQCEKEQDKKKIYLTFDKDKLKNLDNIEIVFNKIISASSGCAGKALTENNGIAKIFSVFGPSGGCALQLNPEPIIKDITVFPALKIINTVPQRFSKGASLTELIICSNTPIAPQAKEDIDSYLEVELQSGATTSPVYEFKGWNRPFLIAKEDEQYHKCLADQFETSINYGLMPEKDYNIKLRVVDEFNQEAKADINFKSGAMPEKYLNFYHFQKNYNVTTPDKIFLTYAAENMDYVNMHICQLKSEDMLYYLNSPPRYWNSQDSIKNCTDTVLARIDLTPRYWIKNYFKVDISDYVKSPRGHFLITFSNPDYKERYGEHRQVYERTYITSTNLGIVEKKVNAESYGYSEDNLTDKDLKKLENLYWITNINRLDAVPGARVDLFAAKDALYESPISKQKTIYTDTQGIAKTAPIINLRGAVVSVPNDSAIISNNENKFEYASGAYLARKMYIYSDRPIYRPGDEVHIKGLYRIGYDGDYEIFKGKKITVKAVDSQEKEIWNKELEVNDFGTFNTDIILNKEAPLGRYRIEADGDYGYFDVEEYVPAPFKVETKVDKEEYISGDMMNLEIDANYYFGAPVEGGEVEYSIGSQNYYFDKYKGEYFDFGSGWYSCYYDCDYGDKFILRNKIALGGDGKARVSHLLDFNKLFKDEEERKSKIFVIYTTVKNKNGQAVSAQKSFIAHGGEFYLGLISDKSFLGKNEEFKLKMKSVDTNGNELGIKDINLSLNKVKYISSKRKEVDGGYYYRWEKQLEEVEERNIGTDGNGSWDGKVSFKDEGEYEIGAKAKDNRANTIKATYNIYVWGEGRVEIEPGNDNKLDVITDKSDLNTGDTANIIIKSPYDKAKALISIERGKIYDYKIVDIDQSLYKYSFDIKEEYIPDIYASVTLLSPKPEIKFGKAYFSINTNEKELDINVKSNKENYLPGEEVILDFEVHNSNGAPARAELSAAVADLSVLALKGNPKKNPLVFFYGGFPLAITTSSNVKNILYEVNVPTGTKGGGGAEPGDLAKKKRGIFKDTAFWQAVVRTDENGRAQVKFTLPDNLTTWQTETVGITEDTKLGAAYKEFIARKDLMVVPLRPRFIIPGDEFMIGAKVFNETDEDQKLEVSLASNSLIIGGNRRSHLGETAAGETEAETTKKDIKIKKGETQTVYFNVSACALQKEGVHNFTVSAKNEKYEDTVEESLSIKRNDTYETTATAGYSKENTDEYIYIPPNVIPDEG
ncbi:MAG: alpha-2-macroglobulin family protein, partial [bacterium]